MKLTSKIKRNYLLELLCCCPEIVVNVTVQLLFAMSIQPVLGMLFIFPWKVYVNNLWEEDPSLYVVTFFIAKLY